MAICPICKSTLNHTHAIDDPAWIDDPIPTALGLSGAAYIGDAGVRWQHIKQLQIYYTQVATDMSVTLPTWIAVANGQPVTKRHIEQLRIAIETLLAAAGLTLEDYFDGDKYGETYTSSQTEWTDCYRVSGYPAVASEGPVRAICVEELRRGFKAAGISVVLPSALTVDLYGETAVDSTWGTFTWPFYADLHRYSIEHTKVRVFSGGFTFSDPAFEATIEVVANPHSVPVSIISSDAKAFVIQITGVESSSAVVNKLSTVQFQLVPVVPDPSFSYPYFDFRAYCLYATKSLYRQEYGFDEGDPYHSVEGLRGNFVPVKHFGVFSTSTKYLQDIVSDHFNLDLHEAYPDSIHYNPETIIWDSGTTRVFHVIGLPFDQAMADALTLQTHYTLEIDKYLSTGPETPQGNIPNYTTVFNSVEYVDGVQTGTFSLTVNYKGTI